MELTGYEFNEKYNNIEFYKIFNEEENHRGFQYVDGLNIDIDNFNTDSFDDGLYFCEKQYIGLYVDYKIYIRNFRLHCRFRFNKKSTII